MGISGSFQSCIASQDFRSRICASGAVDGQSFPKKKVIPKILNTTYTTINIIPVMEQDLCLDLDEKK